MFVIHGEAIILLLIIIIVTLTASIRRALMHHTCLIGGNSRLQFDKDMSSEGKSLLEGTRESGS